MYAKHSVIKGLAVHCIHIVILALNFHFRLNPNYDQAMNNLGNLLKDRGQFDEAERLLEKAVEIR